MARFLFCAFGVPGHIHPMLPAAKILLERGHEVGFLTAPSYQPVLEKLGIRYFEPRFWNAGFDSLQTPPLSRNVIRNLREVIKFLRTFSFPQGDNQVKDIERCKANWDFDVLVCSDMILGGALFAEMTGCVWATLGAFLACPLPGDQAPPWGLGLPPPKNAPEKLRNRTISFFQRKFLEFLSRGWEDVRAARGLPPRKNSLAEYVFSPYLYILPSTRFFDYSRTDLPPHVHYAGPCLWSEPTSVESWTPPFNNQNPILYCTAGTFYNSLEFVKIIMDAVRGQNINLFATLGKNNSPESLGPLPDNVRVAQYVPQSLVLPKVAAVICNGGSGVTMGTILAQKPMVIVPMISDQPENARRCEYLGLAKMLPQKKLNKENAWRAIQAVMQEPRFRLRAEEVGRAFAEFRGAENSASLLEELARTRKPVLQD